MRFLDMIPFDQYLSLTAARWKPYRCEECGNMIGKDQPHGFGCTIDPTREGATVLPKQRRSVSLQMYLILYGAFLVVVAVGALMFWMWR